MVLFHFDYIDYRRAPGVPFDPSQITYRGQTGFWYNGKTTFLVPLRTEVEHTIKAADFAWPSYVYFTSYPGYPTHTTVEQGRLLQIGQFGNTVLKVEFNKDPVKAGICLDASSHDLKGTVTATITPKAIADQVTFESSNPSRATVAEDSRVDAGDSKVVTLKVTGVSETPDTAPGDTDLRALVNGSVCGSTRISVVVPKADVHSVGTITFENIAYGIAGTNLYHPGSRATSFVTITIQDQFGDTLDPIYDGYHVVTEEFQDTHGGPGNFPAGEVFINLPDGNLNSGVIMDEVGDLYYLGTWVDDITNGPAWEAFGRYIDGCNNAFSLGLDGDDDRDGLQVIRVHGHQVTPSYRRTISTKDANYPPIPFTVSDTP